MQEVVGIRRARPEDVGHLTALQHAAQISVEVGWQEVAPWHSWLTDTGVFTYVAEREELLGVVVAGPVGESVLQDGQTGEIIAWFLHPEAWCQKLGRKLLVHGVSVLKRCLFNRAVIWIPDKARRAESIAVSLKFNVTGMERIRNLASGSVNEICYQLDLDGYF
ncbi:MAG: GNAT family N-acetyltransferase [Pseudomonadales bacterium]|nr:GNAT family N-acetyltransferase [Pseudomonadales bacterium]